LTFEVQPPSMSVMRRWSLLPVLLAVGVTLVTVGAAQGAVRRVSFNSPVHAGDDAVLTVNVTPRARCSITVTYDTVVSRAKGVGPKTGGRITWRWRVGTNTHPGRWPVLINCGASGRLRLTIRVLPA
jgi:hypothetical protein